MEPRARILPEDRRFSRVFNGRPELIDHILASHALVHDVDSVTSRTADLPSVTTNPGERREATSDHAPVIARFGMASAGRWRKGCRSAPQWHSRFVP